MMTRVLTVALLAALSAPLQAQTRTPSHCIAIAGAAPGMIWQAKWGDPLPAETVRLSYVGHSTYFIETPGGLSVATDYTGILGMADGSLYRLGDLRIHLGVPEVLAEGDAQAVDVDDAAHVARAHAAWAGFGCGDLVGFEICRFS